MRKVFLDGLPRRGKYIDWKNSIGYTVEFIYDDVKGVFEIIKYEIPIISFSYDDEVKEMATYSFIKAEFGGILGKITRDFKAEVGQIFKDKKRDLIILDRYYKQKNFVDKEGYSCIKSRKFYTFKCNKCGNIGTAEEPNLLSRGDGCSYCCNPPQIILEGFNDILTTDPWMVDIGIDKEWAKSHAKTSNKKAPIKCPYCGKEFKKSCNNIYNRKSISCGCEDGKSYPSKIMLSVLIQSGLNFNQECYFEWSKYYNEYKKKNSYCLYDFVLPDINIIIEVDGGFHRQFNNMSGQKVEESEYVDAIKDELATNNGYVMIRISDEGDIKENILKSGLKDVIDLSKIDWSECILFSTRNIVKEVCDYWKENVDHKTSVDVGLKFGLSKTTIVKYLKRGTILGWCNYDAQKERVKGYNKSIKKSKQNQSKKVEIFNNGVSLGIFESISELSRQSIPKFGERLLDSRISRACKSEKNNYKGFEFKYA